MERPIILFLKENDKFGWLSNWSKHGFYYNGNKFDNVEQFICYRKAEIFDDRDTMKEILKTRTPMQARHAARKIRDFHYGRWKRLRGDIIYEALKLKTLQNPEIIEKLQKLPSNVRIGMADKDGQFGIGFAINDQNAYNWSMWKDNIVGETWMLILSRLDSILNE